MELAERRGFDTTGPWSIFDRSFWNTEDVGYFRHVDRVLQTKKQNVLGNSHPRHAVYLLKNFLDNGKEHIRIFSGSLQLYSTNPESPNMRIYSDPKVLGSMERYLTQNGHSKLEIIVETELDYEEDSGGLKTIHPVVEKRNELQANGVVDPDRFKIHKLIPEFQKRLEEIEAALHVMIVDNNLVRVEFDHEKSVAAVLFYQRELTESITKFFDEALVPNSVPI